MKQLISGGARSGKSRLAQQRAREWQQAGGGQVVVIATARADDSMAERIAHHQRHRPADWSLIEAQRDLAQALVSASGADTLVLVDCLTLWLANELFADDGDWPAAKAALLQCLSTLPGPVIFIGNEVGQGVVPLGESNRRFVDECGWLHQHLGQRVDRVTLTIAGLPLELKGESR
ncbi:MULTISPECIES: bifunctional adenosylcobinamide kinase/adenosylcobinamide-phosphate guanylyltransferase [Ferrimonas]|uniref:bifunctional adenosylcobinamide kinase/adenosylcobinamide-phosphate guanylyltransferase n=1 Tax=Ferrimonas TaxID=44011 RepID=UPI000428C36F|nr:MULTISPECIES: bifunctional adenosylcobinamide kinase/adenosylcobinamide-phosphate guanylyltransferase [Ferrimonas]USD39379.1 bifunctional adenosylcobinamide kinase/adenosylcobinamide-phosphate guanylyltransferase [Ferrimonas sp. SCSIO 43195]